jgi:hypothetical protein
MCIDCMRVRNSVSTSWVNLWSYALSISSVSPVGDTKTYRTMSNTDAGHVGSDKLARRHA